MKIPSIGLRNLCRVVLMFAFLAPFAAQAADTTSAIRGKLVDNGNAVANATVTVRDTRTGATRQFTTNEQGNFYAARLPVGGPYTIKTSTGQEVTVPSIALGDIYSLTIESSNIEEVIVTGSASGFGDVAAGPSANFSNYDLQTAVALNRDIVEVYTIDPRINLDQDGQSINCAGKHPRFNSVTLDGVSYNDRFGLNVNGYSTATGQPFPYDAIQQVSVELAPFDVTYGGFSACNVNAVTKSGTNEWQGNVFYEYTGDSLRGDSIDGQTKIVTPDYTEDKYGFSVGGPLIQDKLFIFGAYEKSDEPEFIGQGFAGSGSGIERPWLSQSDFDRINSIAQNVYNYDTGGNAPDGAQENEKYMVRLDWAINDDHRATLIYNYFDGFEDRASDSDSSEFEFANHYYTKGAESETYTVKLNSQWTDALSTEFYWSNNQMNDSQVTKGPGDFGDFQISVDGRTNVVYLGADDSRQANSLNYESDYFRLVGNYLVGDHVITAGYEREAVDVFNLFVQHSRGGEYDFFDDSVGNSAACAALTAQGRFNDASCGTSGIDKFELGRPSRIYYGSGGGTNVASNAAAAYENVQHSYFIQDEWLLDEHDLTLVFGLRYDRFEADDTPVFNQAFTTANNGLRNDDNIDGLNILMPRIGFNWEPRADLSVRGGLGIYSGGNPFVWISNSYSNDGITNVQTRLNNFSGAGSVLDGTIPLQGTAGPGRAVPQQLFDQVANTTAAAAATSRVVLLDPDYEQPGELKVALGATYDLPWGDVQMDVDYLYSKQQDAATYVDVSQTVIGTTSLGQPIFDFTNGADNFMLTNAQDDGAAHSMSVSFQKDFDFGLELFTGYAYTSSEDVSPMTSSVAGSNFDNVATLNVNDPGLGDSNYVVPHRFTFRAVYARDLFKGLTTRATLYAFAAQGQGQSYVMSGADLEGDGFFGRHLLYVPRGPSDPNVVFAPGFDQAGFFSFVEREDLGEGFVERNQTHAKWSYRADFRIDQELPTFVDGLEGRAFLKIYNLTNMLNDDWGQANDQQFFSQRVVNAAINANGQYVYSNFNSRADVDDLNENQSLWEVRVGLEFAL